MNDLVAGAISGLLGAIVGGLFTAWAARAQVKAAVSSAHLQIKATQEAQKAAAFKSRRLAASDDIVKSLTAIMRQLQEMGDTHYEVHNSGEDASCTEPIPSADCIKQINDWRREFDRITYEHSDFLEDMGNPDLDYPDSPFSYVIVGSDWDFIRRRFPRSEPGDCIRVDWHDQFFSSLLDLVRSVCVERKRYI
ncbi:hypothetical protein [Micromonospora chalcea]|uniref:hypothetical protein n=1 Tax=Micromonospora chalcea TaxID=1874 RepID=UPI00378B7B08